MNKRERLIRVLNNFHYEVDKEIHPADSIKKCNEFIDKDSSVEELMKNKYCEKYMRYAFIEGMILGIILGVFLITNLV